MDFLHLRDVQICPLLAELRRWRAVQLRESASFVTQKLEQNRQVSSDSAR